ncbi:unnamed protein product, partial [Pocillopora meandrina]
MAATRGLCSLVVFLTCWASYVPQNFTDLVVIKTPTLRRTSKIFIPELVYSGNFDVVRICETWLNESVIDSEIIPGYSIFCRDREDLGGGVIVAVKGNIQASR